MKFKNQSAETQIIHALARRRFSLESETAGEWTFRCDYDPTDFVKVVRLADDTYQYVMPFMRDSDVLLRTLPTSLKSLVKQSRKL